MGGNLKLVTSTGSHEASRIDLQSSSRTNIVAVLLQSLKIFNKTVEKNVGISLWTDKVFNNLGFLSGSAKHFFDLNSIDDSSFVSVKPSVGDIDTQVPLSMESLIQGFLDTAHGTVCGDLTFIGYKKSAGQFITLWSSKSLSQNVQIDLELVDFENGEPTNWSNFSHSSSWADMKKGLKGVFHKFAQRALSTKTLREITLLKGKKKVPTKVTSTDLAFSVMKGLRVKLKEVGDGVYEEIPTDESTYITDIDAMFKMFFGHLPSKQEEEMMWSFVGIIELVKKYWSIKDQSMFILGFANTLWGPGAQGIYRGDPARDLDEKTPAFEYLISQLKCSYDSKQVETWKAAYYKVYK